MNADVVWTWDRTGEPRLFARLAADKGRGNYYCVEHLQVWVRQYLRKPIPAALKFHAHRAGATLSGEFFVYQRHAREWVEKQLAVFDAAQRLGAPKERW